MSYMRTIYGLNIIGGPSIKAKITSTGFANSKSLLFDGVDDYVNLGEPANISLTLTSNELTISAWAYCTDLSAQRYIVAKSRPFVPAINYIMAFNSAPSYLFGYFGGLGAVTNGIAGSITTNTWYHTVFTVKNIGGTYTGNLWLNGVKQGSNVTVSNNTDAGTTARIGAGSNAGAAANPYKGNVDEVTFWSVGMTQAEVTALYNSGHPANPNSHSQAANLIHWWRMGDGDTFPVLTDNKGSVSATMTNMAVTAIVTTVP